MSVLDIPHMSNRKMARPAARKMPVQISMDTALLRRVDADGETRASGRSAFISRAVLRYLQDKESARIDEQFRITLAGKADDLFEEVEPFLGAQVWSDEEAPASAIRRRRGSRGAR